MRLGSASGTSSDVTDRAARQLGVVSGTGTFDISDRAARLAGRSARYLVAYAGDGPGNFSSPPTNTLLADTGPLAAGEWEFEVHLAGSAAQGPDNMAIQYRNAANSATLRTYANGVQAGGVWTVRFALSVLANERVRVNTTAALTGNYGASISATRIN